MPPSVTVHTLGVGSGQLIPFTVAGGPANPRDWVALAKVGAPLGTFTEWSYLDGTRTPLTTGVAGATLTFVSGGSGSYGKHEIRFFANDTTTLLATSGPVHVQAVFLSARLNIGRLAAFRLKYAPDPTTGIIIGGINRIHDVRLGTLTVRDAINDLPNTCEFTIDTTAPTTGQNVVITYPGMPTGLFSGAIERVEQVYEGQRSVNLAWRVTCQDYTRQLTRTTINRHYDEQSATAIAIDLVAGTGITTGAVAAGLPVITGGIDFVDMSPRDALTKLMQRVGGYYYVDYSKILHAFLTETTAPPDALVPSLATLMVDPPVTLETDSTQLRNRILVTGGGSTTVIPIAAGASLVPVEDATVFASSGSLKSVTQRFAHTGKIAGGVATNVGSSIATPSTAPSAALSTTAVGFIVGAVSYKVSFKNASGETLPSTASNTVTGIAFGSGGSFGTPTVNAGVVGRITGSRNWRTTFVTDLGETTFMGGTATGTFTAHAAPSAPGVAQASGLGHLIGAYNYVVTSVTQYGETTPSGNTSRTATALAAPANAPTQSQPAATIGALTPGTYQWAVTHVTEQGETLIGPTAGVFGGIITITAGGTTVNTSSAAGTGNVQPGTYFWATAYSDQWGGVSFLGGNTGSFTITAGGGRAITLNIPIGPAGTTARGIFRGPSGSGPWSFVGQVSENVSSTFTDNEQYVGAGGFSGGTMGGQATVSVPAVPFGVGILISRVYRSKVGTSSPLYLVAEVPALTGSAQNVTDNVPDSAFTTIAPQTNTAGGQRHQLTIPAGPTGTLARRIYRTAAGGVGFFLIGELGDNVTTAWIDDIPDTGLTGSAPPVVSSAGGQYAVLSNIPVGPTGTRARNVYRSKASGVASYYLVTQIPDNTTTSLTDNLIDEELGGGIPVSNTAGASAVTVTIPTGPAGITSRRLFRTEGGGSVWRFVSELRDNTTTTFLDTKPDSGLGDVPLDVAATIGALAGATTLTVISASAFPSTGWGRIDSQVITWTGKTATALTGIPSSGDGSLISAVAAGSSIVVLPTLTGVSGLTLPLAQGDPVNVYVQRDNTTEQAALAAREGFGTGVIEFNINDSKLSATEALARADAELALFARPIGRVRYASRDLKTASGKTIPINLPTLGIVGSYVIQSVGISEVGIAGSRANPLFSVEASSIRFSLEDALRRLISGMGGL